MSKVEISENLTSFLPPKQKLSGTFEVRENLRNILDKISGSVHHLKVKEVHEILLFSLIKLFPNLSTLELDKIILSEFVTSEIDFSGIKNLKIKNCEWKSQKNSRLELLNAKSLEITESRSILGNLFATKLTKVSFDVDIGMTDCSDLIRIIKLNKESLREISIMKFSNSELLSYVWNELKLESLSIEFSGLLKDCKICEEQKDLRKLIIYGNLVVTKVLMKMMMKAPGKILILFLMKNYLKISFFKR